MEKGARRGSEGLFYGLFRMNRGNAEHGFAGMRGEKIHICKIAKMIILETRGST